MKIKKRNGRLVNFNPSNITKRVRDQSFDLNVKPDELSIKVISQIMDGMSTKELDNLVIEQSASMATIHPDYSRLAGRIFITALHKDTPSTFLEATNKIFESSSLLTSTYVKFVRENSKELNSIVDDTRDFNYDIFGLKTLERSYLIKSSSQEVIERPQYMWLRVAIEVGNHEMHRIVETYNALSQGYYTHATPTLFNSGTNNPQLSSCFLLGLKDDSIKGIFDTLSDCAEISKWAGGIGVHISNVRANGSHISGTNGVSNGIVPMLKVFNDTARYVDQGGGKRKGSFAMYLEPWHPDIMDFLDLKKNHGAEEMRARDLFYAIWIPDLFMEAVKDNLEWYLFCPNKVKKYTGGICLTDKYGDDFNELYNNLVDNLVYSKVIKARDLWEKILVSQIETGTPYLGYKDRVNKSNNQKNYGVIKSSNLCIEINEYSDGEEQAVCNLASIALPKFITYDDGKPSFDYVKFGEVIQLAVRNLNTVIDVNFYPTPETKKSNSLHRPIGLGVQGLADLFAILKMPFDSDEAREMNRNIFELMYYYALTESNKLAEVHGAYDTFWESPASQGMLQFDLYDSEVELLGGKENWSNLKGRIKEYGLRNSLLLAMMPTASTSQILGNNECFEPFTSNLSTRGTLAGTFIINNKHLVKDLEELGLWDDNTRRAIMAENGSIQNIPWIPVHIKELYKTAYEMSMKSIIDMAADRQRFICQSQSMNLFMKGADVAKLTSMHFYGWNSGLKTGMYYLRSKPAVDAIKFTVNAPVQAPSVEVSEFKLLVEQAKNAIQNDEDCLMCGS